MKRSKREAIADVERGAASSAACRSGGGEIQVFVSGNLDSDLMIVGEGPGEREERERRAFVGASGRLLRERLAVLGFDLERDFVVSNVVCYRTFRLKAGKRENRAPLAGQVEGCRPFLERLIEIIEPKLVIALGTEAARWFLGASFDLANGRGLIHVMDGLRVFPTFHPAAALRPFGPEGLKRKRRFEEDLASAARLIREMR